ncbi:reverse transcriptase domain-containing protein [Streptomyces sp. NBC_01238]
MGLGTARALCLLFGQGVPQGRRPLLANIALSVLDEHLTRPWEPDGEMATSHLRRRRRATGRPNWRAVRYADAFVVLTDGERDDVEALRVDIAEVLQPLGLRLSEAKTQVVHMSDGFDFLGFHIQWRRKDVRRRLTDHNGRWQRPSADGIELFDLQAVAVTRYRYRGNTIPNPWIRHNYA